MNAFGSHQHRLVSSSGLSLPSLLFSESIYCLLCFRRRAAKYKHRNFLKGLLYSVLELNVFYYWIPLSEL